MTQLALLANPDSGKGTDPAQVERSLRDLGATVRTATDAGELAEAAVGSDRIAVAGGDGSVAPAARIAARCGVPLAVIPIGTANDFARGLGLPEELPDACRLAAQGRRARTLDLCQIDDRPFVNAANAGLAVAAGRTARPLKRVLGPAAYPLGALVAGVRSRALECRVECDGRALFDGAAWQVTVAGSGFFGGGSELETADPQDGLLDVTIVERRSRLWLAGIAYGLKTGRVTDRPGVRHARAAKVTVAGALAFNVDGELLPAQGSARFGVQPRAFELIVPERAQRTGTAGPATDPERTR